MMINIVLKHDKCFQTTLPPNNLSGLVLACALTKLAYYAQNYGGILASCLSPQPPNKGSKGSKGLATPD